MNDKLTIVIPCKDEGNTVIEVLDLLFKQDLNFKVVIADSSYEKESLSILEKYVSANSERITLVPGGLPAVARNSGAKNVSTDYILFMDADIYLKDNSLLNKCLQVIVSGDYDLVTCKFKTLDGKYDWIYKIFNVIQWVSSKTKPFAIGGFMMFKTQTFKKLGGFNEDDKIAEDYHLSSKIKPRKFKVINVSAFTLSRRFENKGVWYMIQLAFDCWLNRNDDDFFKQDFDYWY